MAKSRTKSKAVSRQPVKPVTKPRKIKKAAPTKKTHQSRTAVPRKKARKAKVKKTAATEKKRPSRISVSRKTARSRQKPVKKKAITARTATAEKKIKAKKRTSVTTRSETGSVHPVRTRTRRRRKHPNLERPRRMLSDIDPPTQPVTDEPTPLVQTPPVLESDRPNTKMRDTLLPASTPYPTKIGSLTDLTDLIERIRSEED